MNKVVTVAIYLKSGMLVLVLRAICSLVTDYKPNIYSHAKYKLMKINKLVLKLWRGGGGEMNGF